MNYKIDIPLTQACANDAAELASTVSESRAWDTAAMMRALVLAETIQDRLGSFISRTRMALGIMTLDASHHYSVLERGRFLVRAASVHDMPQEARDCLVQALELLHSHLEKGGEAC